MIEFHAPTCADKQWVDPLLALGNEKGCEYNFTSIFAWSGPYDQEVAQVGGFVVTRLCGSLGCCYTFPIGSGDLKGVIEALRDDDRPCGSPLQLVCCTPEHLAQLDRLFPGDFSYVTDRDGFDYLYSIDRLADLPGKKLHKKRTHVGHFLDEHPNWAFEEITQENLPECHAMDKEWYRRNRGYEGDESLGDEGIALRLAMEHYEALGLFGGLLRVDGSVVAFAIGDPITEDTFDVHFEKAFSEVTGAYPMINRQFARAVREKYPQVRYLNREDDMGVDGLRRAKQSYYPDLMVEKFSAVYRGGQAAASSRNSE